jgi:hypothetical protein
VSNVGNPKTVHILQSLHPTGMIYFMLSNTTRRAKVNHMHCTTEVQLPDSFGSTVDPRFNQWKTNYKKIVSQTTDHRSTNYRLYRSNATKIRDNGRPSHSYPKLRRDKSRERETQIFHVWDTDTSPFVDVSSNHFLRPNKRIAPPHQPPPAYLASSGSFMAESTVYNSPVVHIQFETQHWSNNRPTGHPMPHFRTYAIDISSHSLSR